MDRESFRISQVAEQIDEVTSGEAEEVGWRNGYSAMVGSFDDLFLNGNHPA